LSVVMGFISDEWVERVLTPIRKSVIAPYFKGLGFDRSNNHATHLLLYRNLR